MYRTRTDWRVTNGKSMMGNWTTGKLEGCRNRLKFVEIGKVYMDDRWIRRIHIGVWSNWKSASITKQYLIASTVSTWPKKRWTDEQKNRMRWFLVALKMMDRFVNSCVFLFICLVLMPIHNHPLKPLNTGDMDKDIATYIVSYTIFPYTYLYMYIRATC